MKKITIFISAFRDGGVERCISLLVGKFADNNYDISIVWAFKENLPYELDKRVKIIELFGHDRKFRPFTFIFQVMPALIKAMHKLNSDVYISFLEWNNIYLLLAKLLTGVKVVITERTDPRFHKLPVKFKILRKLLYPTSTGFVFQTKQQSKFYNKKIQKKSMIIPNPVNSSLPDAYVGERKKKIVSVGRLTWEKNFPMLIKAFSTMSKRFPDYNLHIYGKGPDFPRLRLLVRQLGLTDKVIFEGFRKDLYDKIQDAALFVMTSDYEGMPNALMEAMALGIPVISTAPETGGVRELIDHGRNGLLVPIGDEKSLAKAMLKVLGNEKLAHTLSLEAVKIRETHSIDVVFRKWENYLSGIVSKI